MRVVFQMVLGVFSGGVGGVFLNWFLSDVEMVLKQGNFRVW